MSCTRRFFLNHTAVVIALADAKDARSRRSGGVVLSVQPELAVYERSGCSFTCCYSSRRASDTTLACLARGNTCRQATCAVLSALSWDANTSVTGFKIVFLNRQTDVPQSSENVVVAGETVANRDESTESQTKAPPREKRKQKELTSRSPASYWRHPSRPSSARAAPTPRTGPCSNPSPLVAIRRTTCAARRASDLIPRHQKAAAAVSH